MQPMSRGSPQRERPSSFDHCRQAGDELPHWRCSGVSAICGSADPERVGKTVRAHTRTDEHALLVRRTARRRDERTIWSTAGCHSATGRCLLSAGKAEKNRFERIRIRFVRIRIRFKPNLVIAHRTRSHTTCTCTSMYYNKNALHLTPRFVDSGHGNVAPVAHDAEVSHSISVALRVIRKTAKAPALRGVRDASK